MAVKGLGGRYYDTDDPEQVKELQIELERRGWLEPNNVDGVYGPKTDEAYRQANAHEFGGTASPSPGRATLDNPNIAPGLPGSAFGLYPGPDEEAIAEGYDPESRPDIAEWQRANLGYPTTPEEEAEAVAQMVAQRELAERRLIYTQDAQAASRERAEEAARILEERKAARKTGILGRIKGVGLSFIDALDKGIDELTRQPYYAAKRTELQGENLGTQLQTFAGGLPGLGFLAGKGKARKAIEETNTPQERAELTRRGELASFGELLSGRAKEPGKLKPEYAARVQGFGGYSGQVAKPIRGVVSAGADVGLNIFGDPLNILFPGATSLTRAGAGAGLKAAASRQLADEGAGLARRGLEFATGRRAAALRGTELGTAGQQAARAAIARGRLGSAAIDAAVEAVRKGGRDVTELSKRVQGLEGPVAEDVLRAARTGTADDVREALTRAFVAGEWDPRLGALRKLTGSITGLGVSGGIVKSQRFSKVFREWARGSGVGLATGFSRAADQVLERTIQRAAERQDTFVGDIRNLVGQDVRNLTPEQRATRILKLADDSEVAAFKDATREELARVWKSSDPAEVDHILTRLETTQVILEGRAGGAAKTQALAELQQGFVQALDPTSSRAVAARAAANLGFFPPEKPTGPIVDARKAMKKYQLMMKRLEKAGSSGGKAYAFAKDEFAKAKAIVDAAGPQPVSGLGPSGIVPSPQQVAALSSQLKKGGAAGKAARAGLKAQIRQLEPELRDPLLKDFEAAVKSKKGLGRVAADVAILRSPTVGPEALRLVQNAGERAAQAGVDLYKPGLGRRILAAGAKVPLSFIESIAPNNIAFQGAGTRTQQILRRVEGADRWATELGLDDTARSALRQAAEAAQTEGELFEAVANGVRLFAVGEGVDADSLEALYRAQYRNFKKDAPQRAFGVDANGKPIKENIFTQAQLIERIPLPDAGDLRDSARKLRKGMGVEELGLLREAGEAVSDSLLLAVLRKGHRAWKFSIVTNFYLPLVGAAAGFGSGEGLDDRLKRAGQGFAIGLLGPARYVLRVPLLEERLRVYMSQGFTPSQWVPGLAKWGATRGVDRPFVSEDIVHASRVLDRLVGGRLLSTASNDYVSLGKGDRGFPEAWWRIVNRQINPESDEVARILLNEKAGVLTAAEATDQVKQFLKTDEGKIFRQRMASGTGGTTSINTIIDRYRQFFDTYITNTDLARARLWVGDKRLAGEIDADISRDTLKQAIKQGLAPEFVHAQRTWVVPRSVKEILATNNSILARLVFEGPTSKINRVPLGRAIYRDEYLRLVDSGVDPKRAQEIADAIAVRKTNKIMFQVNDESRFAKKADYIFPFQQPREEFLRVWIPLVKANPGRAMKATRLAALAFNNGQENGTFRKDPLSKQWVMSVPHSAWLGDKLFGGLPGLEANLKDLLLPAQGAFTPGLGIVPNPGGPWFTVAAKWWATNHPEAFKDMPDQLKGFVFPYGLKGNLMRPEAARLWMGMTGSVPPWEFASRADQQNELDKWQKRIYKELKYNHWKATGDANWEPSEDDMKKAMRGFFSLWAVVGSTFPATSHPITPGAKDINNIIKAHTRNGKVDWDAIHTNYPIVGVFLTPESKYVGPDDYNSWMESEPIGKDRNEQFQIGLRRQLTLDEFKDEFKDAQRRSKAYKEYGDVFRQPGNPWEREARMQQWRERYPDLAKEQRTDYFKKAELDRILASVPTALQDEFIDNWRREFGVSQKEYQKLRNQLEKPHPGYDPSSPWRHARFPEDVEAEVRQKMRQGHDENAYVATLNPAEQVGYWKTQQALLGDYSKTKNSSPDDILNRYKQYGQNISAVYKANPALTRSGPGARFDPSDFNQRIMKPYNDAISDNYAEAARLKEAMDVAAKNKQWTAVYEMKAKRDALFDQIKDLKNSMRNAFPQISEDTDIRALMVFINKPQDYVRFNASPEFGAMPWINSNEEAHYLNMPPNVKKAYVADLVNAVNQKPGTEGKLFWEWLTDFQRDLLVRNLPKDQIRKFQGEEPGGPSSGGSGSGSGDAKGFKWVNVNGKWVLYYKGTPFRQGGSGGSFGGRFYGGTRIGSGAGDLAYALEKFAQYSKRPAGAKPPPAYEAYLALPNNPAVRAKFLKENPEVGEWIKSGPLANMPELERYIVTNIMIKYGKWDGDMRTNEEIVDLSFAREQLRRWNRRPEGASAPENYNIWLAMPPGPEKTAYLKANPEVRDWLRLGPMANMPEEYQTVVRDIMYRYGEWTQQQDPMGKLISEYYKTPSYARKQFLERHPELAEYWALNRTPEEERMFSLSQQYFSIQSPQARKGFLLAHPELQSHFVDSRNKRYERFLNQVAQFMGSNPDMFKGYLDRQNDILSELLRRYAEPSLLRESVRGIKSQTTQGTKKRLAA